MELSGGFEGVGRPDTTVISFSNTRNVVRSGHRSEKVRYRICTSPFCTDCDNGGLPDRWSVELLFTSIPKPAETKPAPFVFFSLLFISLLMQIQPTASLL